MNDLNPIRDLRFEGMDVSQLLDWIGKIKQGGGPESMHGSVEALQQAVQVVVDLDETLRVELGKLRIAWEGNAGSIAQAATQQQIVTMQESQDPLRASADSVQAQGEGFSAAKNSLPDESEMRHQESENVAEWAGGAFGYESDYDEEAKRMDAQAGAAQAALGSYRDTTVHQGDRFRPLPEMRPASVTAQSAAPTAGSGLGGGVGGFVGVGGPAVGGGSGLGEVFVGSGELAPPPGHGEDDADRVGGPLGPGERSGAGELGEQEGSGGASDGDPDGDPKSAGMGLGTALGIGAGGAVAAGIGAVAAGKMLGGKAGTAEDSVRGGSAASGGKPSGGLGRGGSSSIGGGPGDTVAGRTAGGSPTSRPASGSMMGPAATRSARREDDEHENKYAVDETAFDDNRLAAPAVFGTDIDEVATARAAQARSAETGSAEAADQESAHEEVAPPAPSSAGGEPVSPSERK